MKPRLTDRERAHREQIIQCLDQINYLLLILQQSFDRRLATNLRSKQIEGNIWKKCILDLQAVRQTFYCSRHYFSAIRSNLVSCSPDYLMPYLPENKYSLMENIEGRIPAYCREAFQRFPEKPVTIQNIFSSLPYLAKHTLTSLRRTQREPTSLHIVKITRSLQGLYIEYNRLEELTKTRDGS